MQPITPTSACVHTGRSIDGDDLDLSTKSKETTRIAALLDAADPAPFSKVLFQTDDTIESDYTVTLIVVYFARRIIVIDP